MTKDISRATYERKMKAHGFKPQGFLGYWQIPNSTTHVSDENAGDRYRDKLAYMLAEWRKIEAKAEASTE